MNNKNCHRTGSISQISIPKPQSISNSNQNPKKSPTKKVKQRLIDKSGDSSNLPPNMSLWSPRRVSSGTYTLQRSKSMSGRGDRILSDNMISVITSGEESVEISSDNDKKELL